MTTEELNGRAESLADSYLAQGVTFDFAGEERPFPLDAVPRVIDEAEWDTLEAGIAQRVRALEAFLDDVYGRGAIVHDGIIPAKVITSSSQFLRQAAGVAAHNGVRIARLTGHGDRSPAVDPAVALRNDRIEITILRRIE